MKKLLIKHESGIQLSLLFLLARLILILSLPLEGLKSYGDFWNYYLMASQGTPFFKLWVEYPPLFPFLNRGIYLLVGGREHTFIYLLAGLFSLVQAGNIFLFQEITKKIFPEIEAKQLSLFYVFILVGLFYGWAYFDCLVVFFLLLGINGILNGKDLLAGAAFGVGGLLKWFPLLALPAVSKKRNINQALRIIMLAVFIVGLVWGVLGVVSPAYTGAAFFSQTVKGSWETIWAVLDGNLSTGNFSEDIDRLDPNSAYHQTGFPATVSPYITLFVFGLAGLFIFLKSDLNYHKTFISFITLTFLVFLLWSPGYSPQWVLYLLPLVLLSFEPARAKLASLTIVFLNLLEWPVLLSRGWFNFLEEIVFLRTAIFLLFTVLLALDILGSGKHLREDSLEAK